MSSQQDSETLDSGSTQGAKAIYEKEARISLDYSHLSEEYQDVTSLFILL